MAAETKDEKITRLQGEFTALQGTMQGEITRIQGEADSQVLTLAASRNAETAKFQAEKVERMNQQARGDKGDELADAIILACSRLSIRQKGIECLRLANEHKGE